MEIIELINEVCQARNNLSALKAQKEERYAEWEDHNRVLLDSVADAVEKVADGESLLRAKTLELFKETGNKQPVPGVGIREVTKLEYDPKKALAWGLEHKVCLKLDVSAFDKMAKTASELRPWFVQVHTEPQATIATDLNALYPPPKE